MFARNRNYELEKKKRLVTEFLFFCLNDLKIVELDSIYFFIHNIHFCLLFDSAAA
jgi:hypothetical protein